jgi:hypothetical protein
MPALRSAFARHSAGARPLNSGVRSAFMRTARSKEELAKVDEHLRYEFQMLAALAQAIASGISERGWMTNALLESFVIHLRNLLDFFYPPPSSKSDDVVAYDFFHSPSEWDRIRPGMSATLSGARTRANKEIAHLTYARLVVSPESKPWAFLDLAQELNAVMVACRKGQHSLEQI